LGATVCNLLRQLWPLICFLAIKDEGEFPMEKQIVSTPSAPKAIGPYEQAIKVGDLIYASGQIPLDPATGNLVENNITIQTRQVMENLKAVLTAAGSSLERVVKTTVFLKNISDFAAMNEVYGEYLNNAKPARSTVAVADLPRGALVEIDLIAIA
jgi:2-iminobutanoate/2-iminopropanoate deaminase